MLLILIIHYSFNLIHLLQSTVRKSHIVTARGSVAISVLGGSVVVAGVVVLDGVGVGVLGGLVRVGGGRGVTSGRRVRPSQGGGDENSQGDEDLTRCDNIRIGILILHKI